MPTGSSANVTGDSSSGFAVTVTGPNPYSVAYGPAPAAPNATPLPPLSTTILSETDVDANGTAVPSIAIVGVTPSTPIVITVASTASVPSFVVVSGVLGLGVDVNGVGVNGPWNTTITSGTTFTLNGSTGSGSYKGGGIVQLGSPVRRVVISSSTSFGVPPALMAAVPANVPLGLFFDAVRDYQRNGGT